MTGRGSARCAGKPKACATPHCGDKSPVLTRRSNRTICLNLMAAMSHTDLQIAPSTSALDRVLTAVAHGEGLSSSDAQLLSSAYLTLSARHRTMQVVKGQLYKERNQLRMMLDRIALIPEVDDRYQPAAEECLADGVESLAEETHAALTQLTERNAQVTALTDTLNKAEQRICGLLTRNTRLKTTVRTLLAVTPPTTNLIIDPSAGSHTPLSPSRE